MRLGTMSGFPPKELPSGTKLPVLDLKGKPYLQVAHRVVWFRETHPEGVIATNIVERNQDYAIVEATIFVDCKVVANAHKVEHQKHFPDYLEKAETGAIGRALALCGFGTQFAPEFDEGARIVDSPITPAIKILPHTKVTSHTYQATDADKGRLMGLLVDHDITDNNKMREISEACKGKTWQECEAYILGVSRG